MLGFTIDKHQHAFIDELIRSGRYSSANEVMRKALYLLEQRESRRAAKLAALRRDIRKGLDSGPAREVEVAELVRAVKSRRAAR